MSKFTRKVSDIAFSTFTSLFTDFQKPANWGKNYLPISDRDRVARYELLDAIVNNYLGELLRSKSLISVKYDEKGRFIEPYEGYGEAKKIATLISNAILGDDIRLDTDNEELQKLWYDLKMKLVLQDGEDRGAEIGDMVYHIVTNEEGTPFIDWVDPEGFFIFKREFDKILHCAIAYFPIEGTKEEQKLLLVTEYKIFQNVVYWKKARYEVMKDNDIRALKGTGIIAAVLPAVSYFIDIPYAPARKLIENKIPVALATDFNPGSSMTENIQLVMSLAVHKLKMNIEETVNAVTINGAAALGISDIAGSIEVGKQGDLVIFETKNYKDILYHFGVNMIEKVIKKGKVINNTV